MSLGSFEPLHVFSDLGYITRNPKDLSRWYASKSMRKATYAFPNSKCAFTPLRRRRRESSLARRDAWMRQLEPAHPFSQLFDLIPGLYFFAKNRKGEFMLMNRANRQIHHLADETAVVGR